MLFHTVSLVKHIKLRINQLSSHKHTSDIYNHKYPSFCMETTQAPVLPKALPKLECLPARTVRLSSASASEQSFIYSYCQIMLKLVQRFKRTGIQSKSVLSLAELSSRCDKRQFHLSEDRSSTWNW